MLFFNLRTVPYSLLFCLFEHSQCLAHYIQNIQKSSQCSLNWAMYAPGMCKGEKKIRIKILLLKKSSSSPVFHSVSSVMVKQVSAFYSSEIFPSLLFICFEQCGNFTYCNKMVLCLTKYIFS